MVVAGEEEPSMQGHEVAEVVLGGFERFGAVDCVAGGLRCHISTTLQIASLHPSQAARVEEEPLSC